MMKSDILEMIAYNERIKANFHALNTEVGDKKVIKCEQIIMQCQQVIRSMKSVDSEIAILEDMID